VRSWVGAGARGNNQDMARTRRSDPSSAGILRRGRGRGFEYLWPNGTRLRDEATLERIRRLAIPPAWTDVWICLDPFGHLQAVGIDAAGRRQYRYHEWWQRRRAQQKFEHMVQFGRALTRLRGVSARDLRRSGLGHDRVLGCAVRLLDLGLFRIGGEQYAQQNGTYGLATILRRHLTLRDGAAAFKYTAKGGKPWIHVVRDPQVLPVLRALRRRKGGGTKLLAYKAGRRWVDIRSSDINGYIQTITGEDFSAKDFRTWHATVLAAAGLAAAREAGAAASGAPSASSTRRLESRVVGEVAGCLGNTPAVCRGSYIDPRVFDRFRAGITIEGPIRVSEGVDLWDATRGRPQIEAAVLDLIDDEPAGDRRAA
jgi:DNA topoisomerase-1